MFPLRTSCPLPNNITRSSVVSMIDAIIWTPHRWNSKFLFNLNHRNPVDEIRQFLSYQRFYITDILISILSVKQNPSHPFHIFTITNLQVFCTFFLSFILTAFFMAGYKDLMFYPQPFNHSMAILYFALP